MARYPHNLSKEKVAIPHLTPKSLEIGKEIPQFPLKSQELSKEVPQLPQKSLE
jgi:hypothetical protein